MQRSILFHKSEDDDEDEAPIYGTISLKPASYECTNFNTLDELTLSCGIISNDDHVFQHTEMKLYLKGKLVYKGTMYGDKKYYLGDNYYCPRASDESEGLLDVYQHKKLKQGIYTVKYRYNHKGIKTDWETQTVVTGAWRSKYHYYNTKHREDGSFKWAKHPNAYKYDIYIIKASDYKKGIKPVKVASTKKNKINWFDLVDDYDPYEVYVYLIAPVCKYKGKTITVDLDHVFYL